MLNLIKSMIFVALMVVVVYFGMRILNTAPAPEVPVGEVKKESTRTHSDEKPAAGKEKQTVLLPPKVEQPLSVSNSPLRKSEDMSQQAKEPVAKEEVPVVRDNEKEVVLDPIDKEDAQLTAGLLSNKPIEPVESKARPLEGDVAAITNEITEEPEEIDEPIDLKRVAVIRSLYEKALGELSW